MQRKLAAILAADVVGYSRLMQEDEDGTLRSLRTLRATVLEPLIVEAGGRIFKNTGDGVLAEFSSAVAAIQCGVEIQTRLSSKAPEGLQPLALRIGVNLGDVVIEEGGDVFGDGVNVAARLEAIAQPGSVCISSMVHEQVRRKVRFNFVDIGPQTLKNIAEPVSAFLVYPEGFKPSEAILATGDKFRKIAIAVLPFENLSGDLEQNYFSEGITDDIMTELSRYRHLSVTPRNSSYAFQGKQVDLSEIGRRLGVQYLVQGSIRKSGSRVRLNAQLLAVNPERQVWSDRYDRDIEGVFSVQDELTRRVVTTLDRKIESEDTQAAKRKRPSDINAYDDLLRGVELVRRFTKEDCARARELFQSAVTRDPNYAPAYTGLATCYTMDFGPEGDRKWLVGLDEGETFARRALELDPTDADSHSTYAFISVFRRHYEKALRHSQEAIKLNPNSGFGQITRGLILTYTGQAEEGSAIIRNALTFEPYPPAWFETVLALTLFTCEKYGESAEQLTRLPEDERWLNSIAAACCAKSGKMDEAHRHASAIIAFDAGFSAENYVSIFHPYQTHEQAERFVQGLLKAGLPA